MVPSSTPGRATPARAYLDVPYGEKDQAKALGARWDQGCATLVRPHPTHRPAWTGGPPARRYPSCCPGRTARSVVRAVRGHGASVVLVHQCAHLRHAAGLGTAPPHDHQSGRAAVRSVRGCGGPGRGASVGGARAVGLRRKHRRAGAAPADLPVLRLPFVHPFRARQRHRPRRTGPRPPAPGHWHDRRRGGRSRARRRRGVDEQGQRGCGHSICPCSPPPGSRSPRPARPPSVPSSPNASCTAPAPPTPLRCFPPHAHRSHPTRHHRRGRPGLGLARRLHTEGAGADLSWRVGADGEITVAEVLSAITTPSRAGPAPPPLVGVAGAALGSGRHRPRRHRSRPDRPTRRRHHQHQTPPRRPARPQRRRADRQRTPYRPHP